MSTLSQPTRLMTRIAAVVLATTTMLAPRPDAAIAAEPEPFTATYDVRVFAFGGRITVEQRREAPAEGETADRWRYRSVARAKGIARLFVRGELVEDATYDLHSDGRLRPLTVDVQDDMGDKPRDVDFDWPVTPAGLLPATVRATGSDTGEAFDLEVPMDVLDRSLLVPAIGLNLARAGGATDGDGNPIIQDIPRDPERGYHVRILERGEVRDYYARLISRERAESPQGPVDTLVFEHQRDGSSRITRFWLAPSLGYVPVRIEQSKDGKKPHVRATLKEFHWLEPLQAAG